MNSFINILGLATGMAVVILIGLWIHDEVSANKHHKNYSSLYQVMMNMTFGGTRSTQQNLPFPLGEELKAKFPDFKGVAMCDFGGKHSLIYNEKKSAGPAILLVRKPLICFRLIYSKAIKNHCTILIQLY